MRSTGGPGQRPRQELQCCRYSARPLRIILGISSGNGAVSQHVTSRQQILCTGYACGCHGGQSGARRAAPARAGAPLRKAPAAPRPRTVCVCSPGHIQSCKGTATQLWSPLTRWSPARRRTRRRRPSTSCSGAMRTAAQSGRCRPRRRRRWRASSRCLASCTRRAAHLPGLRPSLRLPD